MLVLELALEGILISTIYWIANYGAVVHFSHEKLKRMLTVHSIQEQLLESLIVVVTYNVLHI